ncbi:hypothetical protein [Rubellimicrobium mesophilum]|nr:hypothetical protein [Rubellimicrobium mesophilum]
MTARRKPKSSPGHEKLLYFLMLRQIEAESDLVRAAYERLSDAASGAEGWDLRTVILDWLEAELRHLRTEASDTKAVAAELLRASVALANALKQ